MDKSLFAALLGAKNLTINELRATAPALADEVIALVRRAEAARLTDALGDAPEDVRARIVEIDITRATGDVVEHLRAKLVELGVEHEHVQKVVQRARETNLGRGLDPRQGIGADPAVARQIATARVHEVSSVAGLHGAAAAALAAAAPAPSAIDDATLIKLVSENRLTEAQAHDVGFSAALYELVGDATALAMAIRSASFPRLGGKSPASTTDLAKLTAADWIPFLASAKGALPTGMMPDSAGAALAGRFAALHSGVALTARLPQVDPRQVASAVGDLAPLFQRTRSRPYATRRSGITSGSMGSIEGAG